MQATPTTRSRPRATTATVMLLVGAVLATLTTFGVVRRLAPATAEVAFPASRQATAWPFPWNSIWNMPLGEAANLVPAQLPASLMTPDEDVLLLDPAAPRKDVLLTTAGWDGNQTRCGSIHQGQVVLPGVPIPPGFHTDDYTGLTPNHSAALLMPDGETIMQTQPFHVCGAAGVPASQYNWGSNNIKTGDGINGAHGGSGMSSIGGTIRLGELVPGGVIRHALKMNLDCANLCYYRGSESDGLAGFRWPAQAADSGASGRYGGSVPAVQMGSLLALPPDFDVDSLASEPARIIARALRDYGAYVVDDTGWGVHALATEWSPQGRVLEEFEQHWGFAFDSDPVDNCPGKVADCRWMQDLGTVMTTLHVVDDNTSATVGGAGTRLQPCAPAFSDGTGAPPASCTATATAPTTTTTAPPATTTTAPPATTATPPTTAPPSPDTVPADIDPNPPLQPAPGSPTTAPTPTTTPTATTPPPTTTTTTPAPTTTTTPDNPSTQSVTPVPAPVQPLDSGWGPEGYVMPAELRDLLLRWLLGMWWSQLRL